MVSVARLAQAGSVTSLTWVTALGKGAASDAHGPTGKPEPTFQSAGPELPVQDRPISGACAVMGGPHGVC